MSTTTAPARLVDPVDAVPPLPKLTVLGVQHVLAFYAGAVIVPLVISQGLGLSRQDTIHLINADLLTCGIASIIQSAGLGKRIGVRLPLLQGVTFTAVSPIIAIGLASGGGTHGLAAVYGSIIIAGLVTFFGAPWFAKLLKFFPPVVTGTLLTVMGTTLIGVAAGDIVRWGQTDKALMVPGLVYAFGTLAVIVLVQRVFKGFMATISVLIGLMLGTAVAAALGHTDFSGVTTAAPIGLTAPFFFGWPAFSLTGVISMIIVMAITAVETTGDVFATGEVVGKRITPHHIASALRADGLSTTLGGILNSFPYTCFAQNVGLVRLTRVKSRWVVTAAGVIMIVLGLLPKAGAIVAAIPAPVLGGASLAMFANVAVVGIQTLGKVDMHDNRNAVIVSTAIGLAMLVTLQPTIAAAVPSWLQIIFGSGVTLGSIVAILLNLLFFHVGRRRGPDVAVSHGKPVRLDEVNAMSKDEFVAAFGGLFPVTWPVARAWEDRPFASTEELREAFQQVVLSSSADEQRALVDSYYDISELVLTDPATATEDVAALQETGSLAIDRLDDRDRTEIAALSPAYRDKHGMPWVVSLANLASRDQLVGDGWHRVASSPSRELVTAITEVGHIADARFDALVADANPIRSAWARKFEQLS
ncbi:solute carrier family 23 protein [Raineyella fluvialis]|uniref:Uracil-xanthine permease n=1 Tax=Raineyella fluvialis TaxID=2662261 RepID=A0A5Q2F8Q6_9ACTN|nr:solute carrier family 23 protein [Raineyella fluvialis]QGF23340.1 uracil-xanthine permease [Raineyella fluvialis]